MRKNLFVFHITRVLAALIMLQTLFFKFTAAPESVFIFTTLGVEPWGRIISGILELIASILLFVPGFIGIGALLGIGIMSGAILSHIAILGISVMDDHGYLFGLGLIVLFCCCYVLWKEKNNLTQLISKLINK